MNLLDLANKEVDSLEERVQRFAKTEEVFRRPANDRERRAKQRVRERFPARIWGADSGSLPFIIDCVLDNISSTGLYLRIPRRMSLGYEVRVIVHLLNGSTTGATACIYGEILRDEPQPDGRHGIAVAIKRYKFL